MGAVPACGGVGGGCAVFFLVVQPLLNNNSVRDTKA
jgi:hypothetical protein